MGGRFTRTWLQVSDDAVRARLNNNEGVELERAGELVLVRDDDFDGSVIADYDGDLDTGVYARYGEVVHIAIYHGPSAELCGTFLYLHSVAGQVVRALAYLRDPADDKMRWLRVEGAPEPWEAPVIERYAEDGLTRWLAAHRAEAVPELSAAELAVIRSRAKVLERGAELPSIPEHALARAIYDWIIAPPT